MTSSATGRELASLRRTVPGVCARCGAPFMRLATARYCSRRCQNAAMWTAYYARVKAKRAEACAAYDHEAASVAQQMQDELGGEWEVGWEGTMPPALDTFPLRFSRRHPTYGLFSVMMQVNREVVSDPCLPRAVCSQIQRRYDDAAAGWTAHYARLAPERDEA